MLSPEILFSFIIASTLLSLAPGPDNIFVLTQSALYGKRVGMLITLGLCIGLIVHTLAVALGIAVIFQANALAFSLLKLTGVFYLLYLAWEVFRVTPTTIPHTDKQSLLSDFALFRRGIIMNISNPKVAIFFLAFLPQFTNTSAGSITYQLILLGCLFAIVALIIFSSIAILSSSLNKHLKESNKTQKIINYIAGSVFIGLAIKLALLE